MVVVVVVGVLGAASALPSRVLTNPEVNPGCDVDCEEPWVVMTAGMTTDSTLFHLWGAKEALSFLVVAATGGLDANITVDWAALRNGSAGSITFPSKPSHVFGFVIPSLILYNDADDAGAFKNQNESARVPVSDFTWSAQTLPESDHEAAVLLQTTHFQGNVLPNDTRLLIQVAAYGEDGRSTVLPHLLRTPDSAQLDLVLDNFNLNISEETQTWKEARWGMDVVVFSSEHNTTEEDAEIKFLTQKSLDDEHTPGVFNLDQISTTGARTGAKGGGYLQWRPVSYLTSDRDINEATTPNINTSLPQLDSLTDPLKASLAYAVLGDNLTLPGGAVTTVISFGQSKDKFYTAENYTTWTVALGEGSPPEETFSTLIVVIICIGVALPTIMLLGGCVALGVRRYRRRSANSLLAHQE